VRPERAVLPVPAIGQYLRFRSFAEQLSVEDLPRNRLVDEVERAQAIRHTHLSHWGQRDVGRTGDAAGAGEAHLGDPALSLRRADPGAMAEFCILNRDDLASITRFSPELIRKVKASRP
jgi:hypothetical protein